MLTFIFFGTNLYFFNTNFYFFNANFYFFLSNNLKESCGRSISESEEEAVINIENGKTVIKKNFIPVYSN